MYQTAKICAIVIVFFVGIITVSTRLELREYTNQLNQIQIPKYVVSDEPERIKNTLLTTYPYLKIWGPDVIYYWSGIIYDQCTKRNIDWRVVCAKIQCESGFNPKAISSMNAKGIAQMLDSTAIMIGKRIGITYIPGVTLWNDVSAMLLGIEYLDQGIKREKSIENGLKCYYAGSMWRKNPNQKGINEYATNVLNEARRISNNYKRLYPEQEAYLLR